MTAAELRDQGVEFESDLVSLCCQLVHDAYPPERRPVLELISQRGGKRSGTTVGAPDCFLTWAGWTVRVEFKRPDGKVRRAQTIQAQRCRDVGAESFFVRDVQAFACLLGWLSRNRRVWPALPAEVEMR
jgi:hypothetical protein